MEHCPNCGTPGRPGAKFCTTCGFRFPGDESNTLVSDVSIDPAQQSDDPESSGVNAETTTGWPSSPEPQEAFPGSWGQPAASAMTAPTTSGNESADSETISDSWPDETVDAWPARPATDAGTNVSNDPSLNVVESEPAVEYEAPAVGHAENGETIARAMRLLDELRDTIGGIGSSTTFDLSGVISDLEVAVTPPGAMPADDVAELREALLAARERPRDVDTIVDLTKRIDAMVALVIAYDRSIAAIERSLDALRSNEGER